MFRKYLRLGILPMSGSVQLCEFFHKPVENKSIPSMKRLAKWLHWKFAFANSCLTCMVIFLYNDGWMESTYISSERIINSQKFLLRNFHLLSYFVKIIVRERGVRVFCVNVVLFITPSHGPPVIWRVSSCSVFLLILN